MVSGMVLLDWKVCCGNSIFTLTQSFTSQPHLQGQASQTKQNIQNIQDRISLTWGYPEQNIHDLVISRTEYPWHEDIQDRIFKTEYPWHGDIQDWRISRTWGYPGQEDIQDNVNNYVSFLVFKRSTMPLMLIYLNIDIDKFDIYVFKYLREKIRHVK